jgi:hypothetical protein
VDERGSTVGALYIINQDPSYSDAVCKTNVIVYSISNQSLMPLFNKPVFAREVAYNLNLEIRRQLVVAAELGRTPLLEQKARATPYLAISIAAGVESFYRSAMNAFINASLSGQARIPKGALFPNMHLQVIAVRIKVTLVISALFDEYAVMLVAFLCLVYVDSNKNSIYQWI